MAENPSGEGVAVHSDGKRRILARKAQQQEGSRAEKKSESEI